MTQRVEALVSPEWLAARLGRADTLVVDASWFLPNTGKSGRAAYEAAHIPGAIHVDIDALADPDSPLPHMLPDAETFSRLAGGLGIGDDHHVVVYDQSGMMTAPRIWWTLRAYGHDAVSLLDGGLAAWQAAGHPVASGSESAPQARFTARPPAGIAMLDEVRRIVAGGGAEILDARSAGRFAGSEPEPRAGCRSGHIPGSRNLPAGELVDPASGRLRSPDDIAARLGAAGVAPDRPVVTSCGSGVTACVLALGLHLAGHDDVRVYDGSWAEWGARDDTPVER